MTEVAQALACLLAAAPWATCVPPPGRPGTETWHRVALAEFPPDFCAAALALGLYETHDFRSQDQQRYARALLRDPSAAPYLPVSRFRRWWEGDTQACRRVPNHEIFQAWLVVREETPIGLAVWDRPVDQIYWAPEPRDTLQPPRHAQAMRLWGMALFYVRPEHREQGLGRALAQAEVSALDEAMASSPWDISAIPVLAARDRAYRLLAPLVPHLGLVEDEADCRRRRRSHWRLAHDPWADAVRWRPEVRPWNEVRPLDPSERESIPAPPPPSHPGRPKL